MPSKVCLAFALGLLLGLPAPVRALSLSDAVVPGTTLASDSLLFSDFQVVITGNLSQDPEDYEVEAISGGLSINGPITVFAGEQGTLTLGYQVAPLAAGELLAATSLAFDGFTVGDDAHSLVIEGLEDAGSAHLGLLSVYVPPDVREDSFSLSPFQPDLQVWTHVHVVATAGDILAAAGIIRERFTVVPEPGSLLLMGLGLVGLLWLGRREGGRMVKRDDSAKSQ